MTMEYNVNDNVKDVINGMAEALSLSKSDFEIYLEYIKNIAYQQGVAEGRRLQMNENTLKRVNNSFNLAAESVQKLKQIMKENGVEVDG